MKESEIIKNKKQINKGITLIALVITIIVLLILAGVSIATLTGQNGILNQATGVKEENNKATALEKVQTEVMGSYSQDGTIDITKLNENLNHIKGIQGLPITTLPATVTVDGYEVEIKANGETTIKGESSGGNQENQTVADLKPGAGENVTTVTKNTTITDDKGNQVVIPEGFGIAKDSATIVTDGVVIEDKDGNQFVWIPVGTITKNDGTTAEIKLSRYNFSMTGIESGYTGSEKEDTAESHDSTYGNTIAKDIEKFKTSANNNHGYYIARYEASKNATTGKVESKRAGIWNSITQPDAAIACGNMYETNSFTSDLMNSYAWDTAIVFIQKFSGDTDYSWQTSLNKNFTSTGFVGDEKCHIHDMASNVYEWTTETSNISTVPCVYRGGSYYYTVSYTCYRSSYNNTTKSVSISFRPILYINI